MEQGPDLATSTLPLVERQAPGGKTSDLEHARIWRLLLAPTDKPELAFASCLIGKSVSCFGFIIEVKQPGRSLRVSFWNA